MVQVSILVPVYKCENFVYKCADSLFSQTFEDVEFIFFMMIVHPIGVYR